MEGHVDKGLVANRDNPCRACHANKAGRGLANCLLFMIIPNICYERKYENATWELL